MKKFLFYSLVILVGFFLSLKGRVQVSYDFSIYEKMGCVILSRGIFVFLGLRAYYELKNWALS